PGGARLDGGPPYRGRGLLPHRRVRPRGDSRDRVGVAAPLEHVDQPYRRLPPGRLVLGPAQGGGGAGGVVEPHQDRIPSHRNLRSTGSGSTEVAARRSLASTVTTPSGLASTGLRSSSATSGSSSASRPTRNSRSSTAAVSTAGVPR